MLPVWAIDRQADERQQAAEDAVADVVRQRQRRVADLRRKRLDQIRRDRPVHHRHEHDLDEDEQRSSFQAVGVATPGRRGRDTAAPPAPAAARRRPIVCGVRLIAPVTGLRCEIAVTTFEPAAVCIA